MEGQQGMELTLPYWFNQRQGKAEPAGTDTYQLTAPNLKPAFIGVQKTAEGHWLGLLRLEANAEPIATTTDEYGEAADAWGAAFELYRNHIVT